METSSEIIWNALNDFKPIRYVLTGIYLGTGAGQRKHGENVFLNVRVYIVRVFSMKRLERFY